MAQRRFKNQSNQFERKARDAGSPAKYVLRLYITGATPRSSRAVLNLKLLCEEHLNGRYSLEVVDIYQQPERASEGQVIASPTLVKHLPLPLRRFIGDMSDRDKILLGLDLNRDDS
jgi:circadian clock protein KaiB